MHWTQTSWGRERLAAAMRKRRMAGFEPMEARRSRLGIANKPKNKNRYSYANPTGRTPVSALKSLHCADCEYHTDAYNNWSYHARTNPGHRLRELVDGTAIQLSKYRKEPKDALIPSRPATPSTAVPEASGRNEEALYAYAYGYIKCWLDAYAESAQLSKAALTNRLGTALSRSSRG